MSTAQSDESVRVVVAALGTQLEVMRVHERTVATAWNLTTMVVSLEHRSPGRSRNRLRRPCGARVGAMDKLRTR